MTEIFSPSWAGRQSCCGRMGRTRRRSRCAGVIKSELAVLLESAFLSKQQVRALLDQENPLAYIYERWENDHVAIGDLLCDTIYTAGNDAHRERLTKSKQRRKEEAR